jgi:hypothetical protein
MGPNTWGPNVIKDWTLNYDICHERSTIAMGQNTWTLHPLLKFGPQVFGPIPIFGLS